MNPRIEKGDSCSGVETVMWQSEWDQPEALQKASPLEIPDSEKIKRQFNTFLLGCIKKDNNLYDLKEKTRVFNCGDIVISMTKLRRCCLVER
mmetsp:Transcript_20861/g.32541  ORF Transcript_20861/g.32541 Transcript_20861/m.32541 type:complete len:92 (+) Transcript_20861:122-397(+)